MKNIVTRAAPKTNKIIVQTRKGNSVDNEQSLELSQFIINQFRKYEDFSGAQFRSEPSGIYNCHGLTFASRRTCIYDSNEITKILQDDNYKEVPLKYVMPGDIVLYLSSDGDVEHSAIVISAPEVKNLNIPYVYGKWGMYKEAIHPANRCPYNFSGAKFFRVIE